MMTSTSDTTEKSRNATGSEENGSAEKAEHKNSEGSPKKKSRLGGIFANVRSTKNLVEEQNKKHEWKDSLTLRCEGCGAPQEKRGDMRCEYCGGRLVKDSSLSGGDETS
jgi:hypothetical protein